jgi:hypothetical protein
MPASEAGNNYVAVFRFGFRFFWRYWCYGYWIDCLVIGAFKEVLTPPPTIRPASVQSVLDDSRVGFANGCKPVKN